MSVVLRDGAEVELRGEEDGGEQGWFHAASMRQPRARVVSAQ